MEELLAEIRASVIGGGDMVDGPFGPRPMVYADYTASGRALTFVEEYLRDVVLPLYANTHTESSGTGLQTTRFREEGRALIAKSVGATEDHVVLFCGSGSTGAIDKLVGVLGIRIPSVLDDRFDLAGHIPVDERPVVFIGPYEHHSNELPWRESIAEVVTIDEDADGHVDLELLEDALRHYQHRPQLIGSFSAASNVTGIVTDTVAVSRLLHQYGALAFWDFAAAAPYIEIDVGSGRDGLDAVFLSPHKLIGGPGTPGVLVARRDLFNNRVPDVPGGGTVSYVNPSEHDYLSEIEAREEGGTPDIVGAIRAGLVFQLKDAVGPAAIKAREEVLLAEAMLAWGRHPNLEILGNPEAERLSIISFVVRDSDPDADQPSEMYLHHNFVVAVLNDLFGIQARGGCSCAGPYGHRLLGIDVERSHAFEREITRGCEGIKPGWVRVNFNYFIDDETLRYIVDAVLLIADRGRELLALYRFDPDSGIWCHRDGVTPPANSLFDVDYELGRMRYPDKHAALVASGGTTADLREHFEAAVALLDSLVSSGVAPMGPPVTNADFEALRWFRYPAELVSTDP